MCFWIFKKKKNKEEKNVEPVEAEGNNVKENDETEVIDKQPSEENKDTKKEEKNTTKKADSPKPTTKKNTNNKISEKSEEKPNKMPKKKVYHVSLRKDDGKWQVKYGGGKKAIKLFDTQAEAIKFAEERADSQEGSISIHKKDGKIRKQDYSKKVEEQKEEDK